MPTHSYIEENGLATMLATKRSVGITQEVNLREHVTYMPPSSVNKAAHSGFETKRRCHQKSKTGVTVAAQKGLMSYKILFQNNLSNSKNKFELFPKYPLKVVSLQI